MSCAAASAKIRPDGDLLMFNMFKAARVMTLSPVDADALARKGEITLVDVREAGEFSQMHVPGAIHAPLSTLPQRIETLPAHKKIVFYCLSGQRSARAIEICRSLGKPHNTHVAGGILAWRASGLPVE